MAYEDILQNINSTSSATGTVTCVGVLVNDTVTINGLIYTAVNRVKIDNTEFDISGSNDTTAIDLALSITNDLRVGITVPSFDQSGLAVTNIVTITADIGFLGNLIPLVSSNGTRLAVSGALLTGSIGGATHLWMLNGDGIDSGNSSENRLMSLESSAIFTGAEICSQGVDSFETTTDINSRGRIVNSNDTNIQKGSYAGRTTIFWFMVDSINPPSFIFKEGGTVNNFSASVGIASNINVQAVDQNEYYLAIFANRPIKPNRPYHVIYTWEDNSLTGSGVQFRMWLNGVEQGIVQTSPSIEQYPSHVGISTWGRGDLGLAFYNGGTTLDTLIGAVTNIASFGHWNNYIFSQTDIDDSFEQGAIETVATLEHDGLPTNTTHGLFEVNSGGNIITTLIVAQIATGSIKDDYAVTTTVNVLVRLRKYGRLQFEIQTIFNRLDTNIPIFLPINTFTTLSESAASDLIGIAVNKILKTVTVTNDHLYSDIYDYLQWYIVQTANFDQPDIMSTTDGSTFIWVFELIVKSVISGVSNKIHSSITDGLVINGGNIDGITTNTDIRLLSDTDLTSIVVNGDLHVDIGASATLNFDNVTVTGNVFNDTASQTLIVGLSNGSSVTAGDPGVGNGETLIINNVVVKVEGVTEGASISVIASETVGTITVGDLLFEGLADSTGAASFIINYESAFNPSGLDVTVRTRSQGNPNAAIAEDNGLFTDETTNANSPSINDMTLIPASPQQGDAYLFGMSSKFTALKIDISQQMIGSEVFIWQYWNGSSWFSLSNVFDETNNFKNLGENKVTWTLPSDWVKMAISGQGPFYYVRVMLSSNGTPTVNPKGRKVSIDVVRYLPFRQERTIISTGLVVVATWIPDTISKF